MSNGAQESCEVMKSLSTLIPAVAGFLGVLVGAWLTGRRDRTQRKHSFIEKQLKEFYSPLLGIRSEIKMKSELRVKIQDTAGAVWRELCGEAQEAEELREFSNSRWPDFAKIIEYDNTQLDEELLPAYSRMLQIFRDNMWLAEPETRTYFGTLLEYNEIWNRWQRKTLPPEVLQRLNHGEEPLLPFYEHLQSKHDELQVKLSTT